MSHEMLPAQGLVDSSVMPLGDMLPMGNEQGQKFVLKFNPKHQQHGWIFYDNHGQWVALRRALPHEIERAKAIIEMREVMAGLPQRASIPRVEGSSPSWRATNKQDQAS